MLRLTRARASREGGMTLVELLVAVSIALVVVGAAIAWFRVSSDGAGRTAGRAEASVAVDHAVDRLRQDHAAARARDRASVAGLDPIDFSTAIRTGSRLRGYDADGVTIRDLDVQDIVRATPDLVVFSSSGPAGTRCVRWQSRGGELVREELGTADRGCSETLPVTRRSILVRRSADARSTLASPFRYAVASPTRPATCSSGTLTTVPTARLGSIVAVFVDIQSLQGDARADGRSGRQVRIDLRSRMAEEYQRALGCAP
jgi:type II secretory pathway pseudopilin PulG